MGVVTCPNCEETFLSPRKEGQKLCGSCKTHIQHKMNEIDREYTMKDDQQLNEEEYTEKFKRMHEKRVRRIDHLLKSIPPSLMPSELAQMAEEIKDPEIKHRSYCLGRLDEIESTDQGVQLRDRYNPHV